MQRACGTLAKWSGDVVSCQGLVPVLTGRLCKCSCPLCITKLPLSGVFYDDHDDAPSIGLDVQLQFVQSVKRCSSDSSASLAGPLYPPRPIVKVLTRS